MVRQWTDKQGRLREAGDMQEDGLTRDDLKPLEWIRDSGLLWLFNAILAKHDTAVAVAVGYKDEDAERNDAGEIIGWFLTPGSPIEVVFDDIDQDRLATVRATLGDDVVDAIWAANGLPNP